MSFATISNNPLDRIDPAMYDALRCRYGQMGKIVFDLDDVAHGLNEKVTQHLGIKYEDIVEFYFNENPRLSAELKEAMNQCYRNPKFFRNIQFYPGFERIMELEQKYPAKVWANSNSFGEDVRHEKICSLQHSVPALPPEQMRLGLVGAATTRKKKFDDDTLILVDDSPYNIALSPAKLNILPIQPWNQTEKALATMSGKPIAFVPRGDFNAIYQVIDAFFVGLLSAYSMDYAYST